MALFKPRKLNSRITWSQLTVGHSRKRLLSVALGTNRYLSVANVSQSWLESLRTLSHTRCPHLASICSAHKSWGSEFIVPFCGGWCACVGCFPKQLQGFSPIHSITQDLFLPLFQREQTRHSRIFDAITWPQKVVSKLARSFEILDGCAKG